MPLSEAGRRRLLRAAAGAALGAGIGFVQYRIVGSGMRSSSAAPGLSGIGVAFGYGAAVVALTLVLLAAAIAAVRVRRWVSAALAAAVLDLLLIALAWPLAHPLGLHGDSAAILLVPVTAVATGAAALR